ncbi:MAG: hypothetical protein M1352_02025 [Patescibacteria group bacterium]|nr:hypothetical protein [Patescibacteria group bacterium]
MAEFESSFENSNDATDALKADTAWAKDKEIDRREESVGLREQINPRGLDAYKLLEALEDRARDVYDRESGNLIKLVDYREIGEPGGKAREVIFKMRQEAYKENLYHAYERVEKLEEKNHHLLHLKKGASLTLGSAQNHGGLSGDIPAEAASIEFGADGKLSFTALTDQKEVTVFYRQKSDGRLTYLSLPQEVGGHLTKEQVDQFNREALPGQTHLYILDENGNGVELREFNVVLGQNLKEFLTDQPKNIKELRWTWREIKMTPDTANNAPKPAGQNSPAETFIRSPKTGLTYALASSSADTLEEDLNPANLEPSSPLQSGRDQLASKSPELQPAISEKVDQEVHDVDLNHPIEVSTRGNRRITLGGNVENSTYFEFEAELADAKNNLYLNFDRVQGRLPDAAVQIGVEENELRISPLSPRRVLFHYRPSEKEGWQLLVVRGANDDGYETQQRLIGKLTQQITPENFWIEMEADNPKSPGFELHFERLDRQNGRIETLNFNLSERKTGK